MLKRSATCDAPGRLADLTPLDCPLEFAKSCNDCGHLPLLNRLNRLNYIQCTYSCFVFFGFYGAVYFVITKNLFGVAIAFTPRILFGKWV